MCTYVVGNPTEVITGFSREYHRDLIVMGKIKESAVRQAVVSPPIIQLCVRRGKGCLCLGVILCFILLTIVGNNAGNKNKKDTALLAQHLY